ncbi:MAG: hypothetical protein AUK44_05410 [Porphyromonadaceae bacterium CG2_30_38_12]|nr:MAG: hypothetical protein AUK44_05410 [Porphyromonadaceae bacterium CG2_30_38_12]
MEQSANKYAMQNGLIAGVILSLKFLFSTSKNSTLGILAFMLSVSVVVFLFFIAKRFRETHCDNVISYGQSFSYIFRVYFYGAVISSLVVLVFNFLEPEYAAGMLNDVMIIYDRFHIPVEDSTYEMMQNMYKPAPFALLNVFAGVLGGAFWGLILAGFIKKEKSIFE